MNRIETGLTGFLDSINRIMLKLALVVSVWAADFVVAWLAMENMQTVLGLSRPVAIAAGIALEGVGVVASETALRVHRHNQSLRPGEKPALEWLAWLVLALQFSVGTILIFVNVVWVAWLAMGLMSLALLSTTGTFAHVLLADVQDREAARQVPANPAPVLAPVAPVVAERSVKEHVLDCYRANPHAKQTEVAEAVGRDRRTVGVILARLKEEGAIVCDNGHGVKVL